MVKKTIVYIVLIAILIVVSFLIYQNYYEPKKINNTPVLEEIKPNNKTSNNFKFQFNNSWYEFNYLENTQISQKSTGQFKENDEFKIVDLNNKELVSLLILPQNAEGPTKQSLGSKNSIDITINNINGENFQNNDGKYMYLLNDGKYIYLWTNQNLDNLIFDEMVKSFKINK